MRNLKKKNILKILTRIFCPSYLCNGNFCMHLYHRQTKNVLTMVAANMADNLLHLSLKPEERR